MEGTIHFRTQAKVWASGLYLPEMHQDSKDTLLLVWNVKEWGIYHKGTLCL
jgi:hypothetical protein